MITQVPPSIMPLTILIEKYERDRNKTQSYERYEAYSEVIKDLTELKK